MARRFSPVSLIGVGLVITMLGCGRAPATLVPAKGRILKADGKPLTDGRVGFMPVDDPKGFLNRHGTTPYSLLSEKGEFEAVLSGTKIGLPPGKYRIHLLSIGKQTQIPKQYQDWQTTPWIETIPSTGKTDILLQLDAK